MVRYLRSTAISASALVLLLATDTGAAGSGPAPSPAAPAAAPVAAVLPAGAPPPAAPRARALRPSVLADPGRAKLATEPSTVFTGSGFDACSAPALDAMRAWRGASPYGAVGIYTSGNQRACAQSRLTRDWVRQVRSLGWRFLPTHVGRQAPCMAGDHKPDRIDPAQAVQQGRDEAAEAVRAAKALGIDAGSPVYLDIEAYRSGDAGCSKAVIDFTEGWTQALHSAGYYSGFYSSLDSGIADLVAAARSGATPLPDAVWYARWDGRAATDALPASLWTVHRRAHQHLGDQSEKYADVQLTVDAEQVDTLVAP
ncbi:glycoside hydrolase domain-containing protein [Kitasatospora sp. NPDC058965]|uniref:glycoside hydrolase domain-containing protein n=1 Tax=Kitasatospora sp. NPDC058965 TaxID=3346682 RepID=UPI00369AAABD